MFKELGAFIDEVGRIAEKSIKRVVSGEERMPERTTGCIIGLPPEEERTVHIGESEAISEGQIIRAENVSTNLECSDEESITIIR